MGNIFKFSFQVKIKQVRFAIETVHLYPDTYDAKKYTACLLKMREKRKGIKRRPRAGHELDLVYHVVM